MTDFGILPHTAYREVYNLSRCPHCHCMTKTVCIMMPTTEESEREKYVCGKCGEKK